MDTNQRRQITWSDIWSVISDRKHRARERAFRETVITLAFGLLPIVLGALLSYTLDRGNGGGWESFWHYLGALSLAGQLFLVVVSIAGSNVARLSDHEGVRVQFAGLANVVSIAGAVLTAGLMGQDDTVSSFGYFPINVLSVIFFLFSMFVYFCLAVPAYLNDVNPAENSAARGVDLSKQLSAMMKTDA